MTDNPFMTTAEVASLLGLPASIVLGDAEAGRLPAQKISDNWHFPRSQLLHWIKLAPQSTVQQRLEDNEAQPGVFSVTESRDLDHYHAQPGHWDVRVSQLSPGPFLSRVRSMKLPGVTVYDNRWARASQVQGQSPQNMVMLGADVQPSNSQMRWCGGTLTASRYACTDAGGAINFLLPEGAHDVVLLLEPELLCQLVGERQFAHFCASKHLDIDAIAGEYLLKLILGLLQDYESRPLILENVAVAELVRSEILIALENSFCDPEFRGDSLDSAGREQAVHLATLLASQQRGQISAVNLAAAIGVSQRTLEYAFRQVLGITPGRYLQLTRLNGIHHEIANAEHGGGGVTELALDWGFSHHGRFCAAYRGLFGELPSDTRRRAKSSATH